MLSSKKYILISMDDERSKHLSEVLGNKTCKKIIEFLAEKEASEKDIADALKMPLNTLEYNLKKLEKAGLVEKAKNFFWSQKGKKIPTYKLSNKSIIISPSSSKISSKISSILPAILITGIGAVLLRGYFLVKQTAQSNLDYVYSGTEKVASLAEANFQSAGSNIFNCIMPSLNPGQILTWFIAGAVFGLVVFAILNWRKL